MGRLRPWGSHLLGLGHGQHLLARALLPCVGGRGGHGGRSLYNEIRPAAGLAGASTGGSRGGSAGGSGAAPHRAPAARGPRTVHGPAGADRTGLRVCVHVCTRACARRAGPEKRNLEILRGAQFKNPADFL